MSASLMLNKEGRFTTISSERTNWQHQNYRPEYKLQSVVVSRANLLKRKDLSINSRLGKSLDNRTNKTSSKGSITTCPKQHRGTRCKAEENNKRYCSPNGGNYARSRYNLPSLHMRNIVWTQNKHKHEILNMHNVTHQRGKLSKDGYKEIPKNQQICKYKGNINHSQQYNQKAKRKPPITKEDLDKELDQYMAMSGDR
ncbi:hypothetical protein GQX74_006783 [Glossina fuscipes]|nr:hypothetical protein GQX74_006783 [Glossina fuscipes]